MAESSKGSRAHGDKGEVDEENRFIRVEKRKAPRSYYRTDKSPERASRRQKSPVPGCIGDRDEQRKWFKEGKCLLCGSRNHKRIDCGLFDKLRVRSDFGQRESARKKSSQRPKGTTSTSAPSKAGGGQVSGSNDRKRQRSGTESGVTPESKCATTRKPPVKADITWGQQTRIIHLTNGRPLKKGENDELELKLNKIFCEDAEKGNPSPLIDSWKWRFHSVEVKLPTYTNVCGLKELLTDFLVETEEEFEKSRVVLHHLVGCVSEIMESMTDQGFSVLVERHKKTKGYEGRFEFHRQVTTLKTGGALIEIVVEESLMERFNNDGASIRLGTSGLVKFEDRTESRTTKKAEEEIEDVRKQLLVKDKERTTLQDRLVVLETARATAEVSSVMDAMALDEEGVKGTKKDGSSQGEPSKENRPRTTRR